MVRYLIKKASHRILHLYGIHESIKSFIYEIFIFEQKYDLFFIDFLIEMVTRAWLFHQLLLQTPDLIGSG